MSCWTRDCTDGTIGVSCFILSSSRRPEEDGLGLRFSWPAGSRRRRFWPSFTSEISQKWTKTKVQALKHHDYVFNILYSIYEYKLLNHQHLVDKDTNKPWAERRLSSESDRGILCLFILMLPLFSSPASILSCKHSDIFSFSSPFYPMKNKLSKTAAIKYTI